MMRQVFVSYRDATFRVRTNAVWVSAAFTATTFPEPIHTETGLGGLTPVTEVAEG